MPHVVIEYSREIEKKADIAKIMDIAFKATSSTGAINTNDIKVRAIPYDHYKLEPDGAMFVHLTLSLLEGRSDSQKEDISINIREELSGFLPFVTSISIDIRDMNPSAYKKRLLP